MCLTDIKPADKDQELAGRFIIRQFLQIIPSLRHNSQSAVSFFLPYAGQQDTATNSSVVR